MSYSRGFGRTFGALLVLLVAMFGLLFGMAGGAAATGMGGRVHSPDTTGWKPFTFDAMLDPKIDFSGTYVYHEIDNPSRWLVIYQSGSDISGQIEINDGGGYCATLPFSGFVSGNNISMTVSLQNSGCECSGPGASVTLLGTSPDDQHLTGSFANNCGAAGNWEGCRLPVGCLPNPPGVPPGGGESAASMSVIGYALLALCLIAAPYAMGRLSHRQDISRA